MSINYSVTVSASGYPTHKYGGSLSPVTSRTINNFVDETIDYYRAELAIPNWVYVSASIPTPYPLPIV